MMTENRSEWVDQDQDASEHIFTDMNVSQMYYLYANKHKYIADSRM